MTLRQRISETVWRLDPVRALGLMGIRNHTLGGDREFLELARRVRLSRRALVGLREMHNLHTLVRETAGVAGDVAEVGVYRGGTAYLICHAKGPRRLHLFDTFAGMPDVDAARDLHKAGDFADTSLEDVRRFLDGWEGVEFHPGRFPESAVGLAPEARFSFVHLDVDLYRSTFDALAFFHPRLSPRGMILSHDYSTRSCPGVRQAFDEFFAGRPEHVVPLWDSQALVIKA